MKTKEEMKRELNEYLTAGIRTETIHSSKIRIEPAYQRRYRKAWAQKIVENFDPKVVNPVKVSYRDGFYYAFDGQHTLNALKIMNDGEDLPVLCMIYTGLNSKNEAKLFATQTGLSHTVGALEKLRALHFAEDSEIIGLEEAVRQAGMNVTYASPAPNFMQASKTLLKCYKESTVEEFMETLLILKGAWNGEVESMNSKLFAGLNLFVRMCSDDPAYSREYTIEKLKDTSVSKIMRDASDKRLVKHCSLDKAFAAAILDVYNKGKRNKRIDDSRI